MPSSEAWQAFAGVGGVIIFLGGLAFALRRLGIVPPAKAAAPTPAPAPAPSGLTDFDITALRAHLAEGPHLNEKVAALERELATMRLHLAENFVRRDDYVTNQSRVIGMLEGHGAMLARLEERIGAMK